MADNQRNERNQRNQRNQIDQRDETGQRDRSSLDSWVKVNPDEPAYQRLHLCKYLAELPELSSDQESDTPTE